MQPISRIFGASALFAFISVPAFAGDFDQSAPSVTQDLPQPQEWSQEFTEDQMQQIHESQGLIVRVTEDEDGTVLNEEVRLVTEDVDPSTLTSDAVDALFASAVDVPAVILSDENQAMNIEMRDRRRDRDRDHRRGWDHDRDRDRDSGHDRDRRRNYRPYRTPMIFGPYGPVVYRNPLLFPNRGNRYWYYPRWR